jgi:hypothetical protein
MKCAGGPPKPGPGPSPAQKLRPGASTGMAMGRIFSARNNRNFFEPGPNPAQPEKCSGLPLLHVGPCRQFLSELDEAPCPARFDTFLSRSSEFVIFSGLAPGLLGVMFASLHDLYRASRSCHKVLDELIPEVLLSTLKPCKNTKLQNRHARMNLLY